MRRILAAVLVLAGSVLGWTASADAATVVDVGWWDRNADALLPALDPPPDGALRVANDPTGPSAVAAVRFELEDGEADPTLVLRPADDPVPADAGFVACPATSDWEPAEGGPLADAPTADCEISAALGAVAADGTSVSFDLSTFPDAPVFDVVISPAPSGTNPVADTYAVDFESPTGTDVVAAGPAPAPGGGGGGTAGGAPAPAAPATGSSSGSSSGFTPPASPSGGGFTSPGTPSVTVPSPTAGPGGATGGGTSAPVVDASPVASPPLDVADDPNARWVGLVIAAAAIAVGVHLWRTDRERAAMTAGPVLGGLGRFVRERTAPAPDVT